MVFLVEVLGVAQQVFDEMVSRGLAPISLTYKLLIDAYASRGKCDEAAYLVQEMQKQVRAHKVTTLL